MGAKHALAGVDGFIGTKQYFTFDPKKIVIDEGWNERESFDTEEDIELRESIIENGVEVPLTVKKDGDRVVLIDGERRLRAVQLAINDGIDIQAVPIIVERKGISDIEAKFKSLAQNNGKPYTPIEEAKAFGRLINWGISAGEIAKRIGKSDVFVYKRLKLIDATPEVAKSLAEGAISIQDAVDTVEESDGSVEGQGEVLDDKIKAKRKRFSTVAVKWDGEFDYKVSKIDDRLQNDQDRMILRQFLDAVHQHLEGAGFVAGEIKIVAKRELE